MIYKQSVKKFKAYSFSDIISFHKYAYYGDLEAFKNFISKELIEEYFESIYYCINYGCKRNFEFAEYILNNIEFVDIKYKMSITATYIRNGKYDSKLFLDKFDYSQYRNIFKKNIIELIKYKKLHNILKFISVLNSFDLDIECTDLLPINKLKHFYNLPDNSQYKKLTDHSNFVILTRKYNKENLDPYSFSDPPGDYKNICNIERELLRVYLEKGYKEFKELSPLNDINIMNDIRFAIEAYSKNILIDFCLSKFVLVSPLSSIELVKQYNPFLVFGNACYEFDFVNEYIQINPLYRHSFIYSAIMYHYFDFRPYLGEYIDYCYIDACIKSCNYSALMLLKLSGKKCYNKLDFEKNKFINNDEEIIVDYDNIVNNLKLDVSIYKFLS